MVRFCPEAEEGAEEGDADADAGDAILCWSVVMDMSGDCDLLVF